MCSYIFISNSENWCLKFFESSSIRVIEKSIIILVRFDLAKVFAIFIIVKNISFDSFSAIELFILNPLTLILWWMKPPLTLKFIKLTSCVNETLDIMK